MNTHMSGSSGRVVLFNIPCFSMWQALTCVVTQACMAEPAGGENKQLQQIWWGQTVDTVTLTVERKQSCFAWPGWRSMTGSM